MLTQANERAQALEIATRKSARRKMILNDHIHACAIFMFEANKQEKRTCPYRLGATRMLRWTTAQRLHYCVEAATMAVERLDKMDWDFQQYCAHYVDGV